jgi:hypothetical protein
MRNEANIVNLAGGNAEVHMPSLSYVRKHYGYETGQ